MDMVRQDLYNRRMRKKIFRTAFHDSMEPSKKTCCLHVLGYRIRRTHIVDVRQGTPCWFLHHFHTPVNLQTTNGIIKTAPNTFAIDEPGKPIYHGSDSNWLHSWIRISGTAVLPLIQSSGLEPAIAYALTSDEDSLLWLEAIDAMMNHSAGMDQERVYELIKLWLGRVYFLTRRRKADPVPDAVLVTRRFIETNYLKPLSLDAVAKNACLSRSQTCRLFRRFCGTSPLDYVIRCRLQHAQELLQTTCLSVGEVAFESGFNDIYYFSRLYKQRYGIPPSLARAVSQNKKR